MKIQLFNRYLPNINWKHKQILKVILKRSPYIWFVYGSRARGDNDEYSDLDLCVYPKFKTLSEKQQIQQKLANSNLPFSVGIIEWDLISKDFQREIEADLIPLFL